MNRHLVIGLQSTALTRRERGWLRNHPPRGVILFGRNVQSAGQVSRLLAQVSEATGQDTWAAIDEEGGRVNRMPWPPFSHRKTAAEYGRIYVKEPERACGDLAAESYAVGCALRKMGFTHNCAPVLDVFHPGGHAVVGERAYGSDVGVVSELGRACMEGLAKAGIDAVGKHFPGHGRADSDSHTGQPYVGVDRRVVLAEAEPFRRLIMAGLGHVMAAHVVYAEMDQCIATFSRRWLRDILRGDMAFSGHIWSDDLSMKGTGCHVTEAASRALKAGCDVLLVCDPADVAAVYAPM